MRSIFAVAGLSALAALSVTRPASALTVRPVTAGALKQVIAHYRGHVVLVNFWATWCIPCMKEFPDLVRLSQADRGKGLVVLAVSGDTARDVQTRVVPFLTAHRATFPQFIIRGDLDAFVNGFQPKWQADFPQTFIFDKRGRQVREMTQQQSLQSWQAALAPLLNKKG